MGNFQVTQQLSEGVWDGTEECCGLAFPWKTWEVPYQEGLGGHPQIRCLEFCLHCQRTQTQQSNESSKSVTGVLFCFSLKCSWRATAPISTPSPVCHSPAQPGVGRFGRGWLEVFFFFCIGVSDDTNMIKSRYGRSSWEKGRHWISKTLALEYLSTAKQQADSASPGFYRVWHASARNQYVFFLYKKINRL